jgi:3-phosphoshikimate 1-carboxyvinyltransferase
MPALPLHTKSKSLKGKIILPTSKSISNRILIIRALCRQSFEITNVSEADDTLILQNLLNEIKNSKGESTKLDCGNAGTAFRFLTAFLANKPGNWELNGSERMNQRPVRILVDALTNLGANIQYREKTGFPPLLIKGKKLKSGIVNVDATTSSQYISALLMIAPILPKGLELHLSGKTTSLPYIEMTLRIMGKMGIKREYKNNNIKIPPQKYLAKDFKVEPDWSSAAYWYELAAFSDDSDISLPGLEKESRQGDAVLQEIYKNFGIQTDFLENGIRIVKTGKPTKHFSFDFTDFPDLVQSVVVTCAGLNIPGEFIVPKNLQIKETDRIKALQTELEKLGYQTGLMKTEKHYILSLSKTKKQISRTTTIKTYNDHRMALAFAPLCLVNENLEIENPEVVSKSYPGFWEDVKQAGII